jgi:hypothetical protein
MKRLAGLVVLFLASGCSTAPVADFLDWAAPSHVGPQTPVAPVAPVAVKPIEPIAERTPIAPVTESPSAPTVNGTALTPEISGLR